MNMKASLAVLALLLFIVQFASCEKDDICVEGDTPLLVIGFYDVDDTTEFKSVANMRIKLINYQITDDSVGDSILSSTTFASYGFTDRGTSPDSILLPLQTATSLTQFEFISGSSDDSEGNEAGTIDTLGFSYTVNEEFVSRACGFVANFDGLDTLRTVHEDDWIQRITINEVNIEQSNAIHIKIFH